MAIIGMGCLFPKSPGVKAYWRLLFHGENAITDVPETHWSSEIFSTKILKNPIMFTAKREDLFPRPLLIPPNSEFRRLPLKPPTPLSSLA